MHLQLEWNACYAITAGHLYNRIWVTTAGCLLWGIMTAGFAFSTSLKHGLFFWGVNGAGQLLHFLAPFVTTPLLYGALSLQACMCWSCSRKVQLM